MISCLYLIAAPGAITAMEPDIVGNKEWKDGVENIIKVEPSVVCHDGESIQVLFDFLVKLE